MPDCDPRELSRTTGLPLIEVRLLAEHATGIGRTAWMADPVCTISANTHAHLQQLLARRVAGEPVAYLLGCSDFFGRTFQVGPGVLIPRPETEELVEHILAFLSARNTGTGTTTTAVHPPDLPVRDVLDVGTGSGVIAVTLALERTDLCVHACDISTDALTIAQHNAQQQRASVAFRHSDWLSAYPMEQQFDLIVSNPPYIVATDIHLHQGDLRHEPRQALTDESDGLSAYRALASACQRHLRPGGSVWVEHGWHQQNDVMQIFEQSGLCNVSGFTDLSGHSRMVCAFRAAD